MIRAVEPKRQAAWLQRFALRSKIQSAYLVLAALVLLIGRYDWSQPVRSPSKRGYFSSAFFICLLIPLIAAILDRSRVRTGMRNAVLGAATLLVSLPYHWLNLERWSFHRNRPDWFDWRTGGQPKLIWFPEALWAPAQIPGELLFFGLVAAVLLGGGWWYARARRRSGRPLARSAVVFGGAAIALIVIESWMHISLRSPYTYICHFEHTPQENHWYHVFLFANAQGAVNADYFVFRGLEEVFMGTPHPINGMLIRRPFPYYVSSQFSYFINPYYVMLALNIAMWLWAVLAMREYVAAHFDNGTAALTALLTASGPGFIMYVAQPQTYLWGYCAVALVIWAHWRICGRADAKWRDYVLFGGLLALSFLTYDVFVLLLYLAGYELLFKKSLRKIAVSAALALAIYAAFGLLTSRMRSFVHDPANADYLRVSLSNTIAALHTNPLSLNMYSNVYTGLLANYAWNLSNAVFVFPLLAALAGLFLVNNSVKLKLAGLLFLPSFAAAVLLFVGRPHLGSTYLSTLPRFCYIGFPAVYVLCGIALWKTARAAGSRLRYGAAAVLICGVAAHLVLTNVDVFGYPWLYYLFYYEGLNPAYF